MRMGYARFEAIIEDLKRALNLGTSEITAASFTATTGGLTVTAGETYLRGSHVVIKHQGGHSIGVNDDTAFTDANFLAGIITVTVGGDKTKATPTAESLISTLKLTADNDSADIAIMNTTGAGNAHTLTLLGTATGVSLVGSGLVTPRTSGTFRVRRVSDTTVTIYRVA